MKYKYEFKNKALGEAVYTIFGEEFVRDEIEQQMLDSEDFINLEVDEWDEKNKLFNSHIEFPKTELEKTLVYDPAGWNPYPEIKPPEGGEYIVSLSNGEMLFTRYTAATYGPSASDCVPGHWGCVAVLWGDLEVVAFRECPEPYRKPEKCEVK